MSRICMKAYVRMSRIHTYIGLNKLTLFICCSLQESLPANTNILYVDLHSVEKVVLTNSEKSLPGMVLNLKKPVAYFDQFGRRHRYIIQQIAGAELLLQIFYLIKCKV